MFSIQGEVISDQFYHFKFILFCFSVGRYGEKTVSFWNFDVESIFKKNSVRNPEKSRKKKLNFQENIARGTTDPGY